MIYLLWLYFQDPLTSVPAPDSLASWWPFAMAFLSLVVAGISAAFAAWVKLSEKKVDGKTSLDAAEAKAKVDRLRAEFDDQEKFRNTLMEAFEKSLEENEKLRASIAKRDQLIAELRGKVESMRLRIMSLEKSVCVVQSEEKTKLTKISPTDTLRDRVEKELKAEKEKIE